MMKKIILILCMLLSVAPICAETTYTIDTEYGEKTVVIPDGYTEKDVLLVIAKNYYELNEEDKILKEKVDSLTTQVTEYVSENKVLREKNMRLQNSYSQLLDKYKSLNSMGFVKGFITGNLSYTVGQYSGIASGGADIGIIIGDSFMLKSGVCYPWQVTFGVGIVF